MPKTVAIVFITTLAFNQGYSQLNYSLKAETGVSRFQFNTVNIDPGPNWKGYYLEDKDGIDFHLSNGVGFKDVFFAGIGLAYLNFEGIHGLTSYADIEFLPIQTKLKPLINLKLGYSHIWNQYENGTTTGFTEICVGINYQLTENMDIYIKTGFSMTQQSLLIPIRLGVRF